MRTRSMTVLMLLILAGVGSGCGKGWEMDYGKPAAQFLQADLATKEQAVIGKKITVKGTVTKVDVSSPDAARVCLARHTMRPREVQSHGRALQDW